MAEQQMSLSTYVHKPAIENRFIEVLGEKKAKNFISTLIGIYNGNPKLQECHPVSIVGAAGLAAITDLSISPTLGQAYIVPYKGKATFQIGWKGLVQLAHRTGKYTALNAGKVYEGEIERINPVTGEPVVGEKISDKVVGYVAYMRFTNGFEKTLYMTKDEIEAHALKYSQSYAYDKRSGKKSSPWSTNFDAMASKTVLKKLLNNYGILSTEMVEVIQADQAVVDRNSFTYVDNGGTVQDRNEFDIDVDDFDSETVTDGEMSFDAATGELLNVGGTSTLNE